MIHILCAYHLLLYKYYHFYMNHKHCMEKCSILLYYNVLYSNYALQRDLMHILIKYSFFDIYGAMDLTFRAIRSLWSVNIANLGLGISPNRITMLSAVVLS